MAIDYKPFYKKHLNIKSENEEQISALCPWHDDKNPSLSVNTQTGQFKCHAEKCGKTGNAFTFAKLRGISKDKVPGYNPNYENIKGETTKEISEEYNYIDKDGNILFQTVRYEPKDFKQRRPDGNGGWIWNLKGIKLVPYHLVDIVQAEQVIICEGEKDVETLRVAGFSATTNPLGARKWKSEYNQYFKGKDVIVIGDNDESGKKHKIQVIQNLTNFAKSIKDVELPVKQREDVSDYLKEYNPDKLKELINTTPYNQLNQNNDLNCNDVENAERFVRLHGKNVKFCQRWGRWFIWDNQRWCEDDTVQIIELGQEAARTIFNEAKNAIPERVKSLAKWATQSLMANRITALLQMVKPKLAVRPADFDQNTWLFNCLNGTVDLKTGELLPHKREDLITKLAPVNFDRDAKCPKFKKFLNEIFNNNQNIIDFLQALFGYCMTGETYTDIFSIFWGSGANGKSTLMGTIQTVIGDYSKEAARDLFLNKIEDTHPTGLADLVGSRLVVTIETDENKRLAESLIKQLSGGDRIKARFMRQDYFEFEPTFKMILITNHKPIIHGTDTAIWRRIALLPFTVQIPPDKQNEQLRSYKFRDEWPGILNWLIEGCLMWQKVGLLKPPEVIAATEQYKSESDIIGDWLTERAEISIGFEEISKQLYEDYSNFCEQLGDKPISNIVFGKRLAEKGFNSKRTGRKRYWRGLKLKIEHKNGDR